MCLHAAALGTCHNSPPLHASTAGRQLLLPAWMGPQQGQPQQGAPAASCWCSQQQSAAEQAGAGPCHHPLLLLCCLLTHPPNLLPPPALPARSSRAPMERWATAPASWPRTASSSSALRCPSPCGAAAATTSSQRWAGAGVLRACHSALGAAGMQECCARCRGWLSSAGGREDERGQASCGLAGRQAANPS